MSCRDIQSEWLMTYALGEADALQQQVVSQHLASCDACRQELASVQQVLDLERQAPAPAPAKLEGLVPLLQRQAQAQRPSWSMFRHHPSLAAAAVALLALFFSAGFVQGKLVANRNLPSDPAPVVQALPSPPDLGLLQVQTVATTQTTTDRTFTADRDAQVDSL